MTRQPLRLLIRDLESEPSPSDGFVACRISATSSVRIGKSRESIALLVPVEREAVTEPDLRLEHLAVTNFARCSVTEGGRQLIGDFGIVECLTQDPDLQSTFLDVLDWLLPVEGDVTTTDARSLFRRVIRLLREPEKSPRTSALGLWGELLIVSMVGDAAAWAQGWHSSPGDRWDFSIDRLRIEVKTSTTARRHHFSLEQLAVPSGTRALVISVVTTPSSTGPSIRDLLERAALRLGPSDRATLVETAIASLGHAWGDGASSRFDEHLAVDSLRVYEGSSVPRLQDPPPEISEVRFVVDFSDLDYLEQGLAAAESGPMSLADGGHRRLSD